MTDGRPPAPQPEPSEREAWAILASVDGLGPVGFGALIRRFGSARAVLEISETAAGRQSFVDLDADEHHGRLRLSDLGQKVADAAADGSRFIAHIRTLGLTVVTLEDASYPSRLRTIEFPPHVLFVRGSEAALSKPHAVAIVGTRRPSDGGRRTAARITAALARLGVGIVSGLAVGIDGAAHAAAVDVDGCTIAVLAGGHAHLYPRVHERLADRIAASGGAVVAELPPATMPVRGTFPRRNRLISGLADATVVVEAGHRSGALITAGWALEQGRECFVVPGAIDSPTSAGALAFLRAFPGVARIVAGIPELIEDLDLASAAVASQTERGEGGGVVADRAGPLGRALVTAAMVLADVGEVERSIGMRIAAGPATVDELVDAEQLPVAAVLGGLTLLEMRGLARGSYGRYVASGALLGALPESDRDQKRGGVERSVANARR